MRHDKLERELDLMLLLVGSRGYRVEDICERLDISRRNFYYYMEFFRDCGFIVNKERGLYSIDRESPFFKRLIERVSFTEAEQIVLRRLIEKVDEKNAVVEKLKEKLGGGMDFQILNDSRTNDQQAFIISQLHEAIKYKQMAVLKGYSSPHGRTKRDRLVEPFLLMNGNNEVRCYEPASGMNKTFKVARIQQVVVNFVKKKVSPIKEILAKKDFSDFSILLKDETIPLENAFHLQVNVKLVGTFHFIFNKEGLLIEELVSQISPLKDEEIFDGVTAREKVKTLLNIVNKPTLLFMVYDEEETTYLDSYFLQNCNTAIQTFVIEKEKPYIEVDYYKEIVVGTIEEEEPKNERKEKINKIKTKKAPTTKTKKKSKISLKSFFASIVEKKFHYLLLFVSTTLFSVSIPLAIINIYSANAIYVFLFICALIGIGMDAYSYIDLFKHYGLIKQESVASYITNILGIGSGIGLFILFYHLSNVAENTPAMGIIILIGAGISLGICLIAVLVSYLIAKRKPKAKKE